jgi:thioredoxin 1
MFTDITNFEEFGRIVCHEPGILVFFSGADCGICRALKPKVELLIEGLFPAMKLIYVNVENAPQIAVQNDIFTVPAILVFFDGQVFIKKVRNFSLTELQSEISRLYNLMLS